MTPCAVNGARPRRATWRPRATVFIVILIIMGIAAAEGWPLPDVTTLIVTVAAVAGLGTVAAGARPALAGENS
jgi:hypothetical protein